MQGAVAVSSSTLGSGMSKGKSKDAPALPFHAELNRALLRLVSSTASGLAAAFASALANSVNSVKQRSWNWNSRM